MNALPYLSYAALKESGRDRSAGTRSARRGRRAAAARPSVGGTAPYCLRAAARGAAR